MSDLLKKHPLPWKFEERGLLDRNDNWVMPATLNLGLENLQARYEAAVDVASRLLEEHWELQGEMVRPGEAQERVLMRVAERVKANHSGEGKQ